jgi:hypothetical protein
MKSHPSIAIISADDAFVAAARADFSATGSTVTTYRTWTALPAAAQGVQLLVFDSESLAGMGAQCLESLANSGPALMCLSSNDDDTIRLLRSHPKISCVVAKKHQFGAGGLAPMGQRLISRVGGSLTDYLAPDAHTFSERLQHYDKKDACFERIGAYLTTLPSFPDFPDIMSSVILELVMNAFIDAPAARLSSNPPAKSTEILYGSDDKHFAVSVTDYYGSLDRESIVETLDRCQREGGDQIRSGSGGAGIGIYLIFYYARQLEFSVKAGVSTAVTVVVPVSKRYKDFSRSGKVFNFVFEG